MTALDVKLKARQGVIGTFCHLGGAITAECLALSGLDYVILDTEHGPFSEESIGDMIRALQLHGTEPFVRVRDSSRAAVLHALDLGARGLIIPDVQSAEEAGRLVQYAKYFPLGARGFAFSRSAQYGCAPALKSIDTYFESANRHTLLMPQCETLGALREIEEIASMAGIDGIFVGPYDLSVALGTPACFSSATFQSAVERILNACLSNGKLAFIYANTMSEARKLFSQGYQGVAIGTDTAFLIKAVQTMLQS